MIQKDLYKKLALACYPGQQDRLGSLATIVKHGFGAQVTTSHLHQVNRAVKRASVAGIDAVNAVSAAANNAQRGISVEVHKVGEAIETLGSHAHSVSKKLFATTAEGSRSSTSGAVVDHAEDGGSRDVGVGAVSGMAAAAAPTPAKSRSGDEIAPLSSTTGPRSTKPCCSIRTHVPSTVVHV